MCPFCVCTELLISTTAIDDASRKWGQRRRMNGVLRQLHVCDEAAGVERKQCLNVFVGGDFTGVAPSLHPSCFHVHVIAVALEGHRNGFERELGVSLHGELTDNVASDEELRAERYLDVRVDEGGGGIAVVRIHG